MVWQLWRKSKIQKWINEASKLVINKLKNVASHHVEATKRKAYNIIGEKHHTLINISNFYHPENGIRKYYVGQTGIKEHFYQPLN